jgi:TatD DNase family protein
MQWILYLLWEIFAFESELESVFKSIPDDKIFLETDTVSENIAAVYELAATYKGISMLEMQELIKHIFTKCFFK